MVSQISSLKASAENATKNEAKQSKSKLPKAGEYRDCSFVYNGNLPKNSCFEPVEPSIMREFRECSSVYEMPQKNDESEISSDGEFIDAKQMKVYHEDATEVFLIEKRQNCAQNLLDDSVPQSLVDSFVK